MNAKVFIVVAQLPDTSEEIETLSICLFKKLETHSETVVLTQTLHDRLFKQLLVIDIY